MEKTEIIKNLCQLLLEDRKDDGIDLANANYPFSVNSASRRQYSKFEMCKCYLSDGFIDRYSGDKLIFPGLLMILSIEFPDIFKYHRNWKMSETHSIYWELFPTIDHLNPVARGGNDNEENWITTSMIRNSAKSNWTIKELGWDLLDKVEKPVNLTT
ncbi:HNH endonuclease [Flavobacterium cupreum]|uniref:HNH endonuclease n=1 Tax=Flavobacterium cupreum TaxID=2133766 RepID=A0A434A004_9FLAO|nr:HNH endonuclease [Flavobacterium cupreum]RUT67703.1 HNH endonuclease [Flavobacterium cupreum]